jgi:hypothetical protein
MATTLTLTPEPANGAILIEVTDPQYTDPTVFIDLNGDDYTQSTWDSSTEKNNWTRTWINGATETTPPSSVMMWNANGADVFQAYGSNQINLGGSILRLTRNFTGLASGNYRLTVTVYANFSTDIDTRIGVVGGLSKYIGHEIFPAQTEASRTFTLDWAQSTSSAGVYVQGINGYPMLSRFRLERLPDSYVPTGYTLIRHDANGSAEVRRLTGQDMQGGVLILRDYEAALAGPVTYTAYSGMAGAVSATETVVLGATNDVLSLPVLPQYRAVPDLTTELTATRPTRATVHQVVGRPDPLVAMGPLSTRSGTVRFLFKIREQAEALEAIYNLGEVLFLRFSLASARDLYHVPTSVSLEVNTETYTYTVVVDYVEVTRPTGPLLGAFGWTYEDIAAKTYLQVKQQYPTYGDLVVGS